MGGTFSLMNFFFCSFSTNKVKLVLLHMWIESQDITSTYFGSTYDFNDINQFITVIKTFLKEKLD